MSKRARGSSDDGERLPKRRRRCVSKGTPPPRACDMEEARRLCGASAEAPQLVTTLPACGALYGEQVLRRCRVLSLAQPAVEGQSELENMLPMDVFERVLVPFLRPKDVVALAATSKTVRRILLGMQAWHSVFYRLRHIAETTAMVDTVPLETGTVALLIPNWKQTLVAMHRASVHTASRSPTLVARSQSAEFGAACVVAAVGWRRAVMIMRVAGFGDAYISERARPALCALGLVGTAVHPLPVLGDFLLPARFARRVHRRVLQADPIAVSVVYDDDAVCLVAVLTALDDSYPNTDDEDDSIDRGEAALATLGPDAAGAVRTRGRALADQLRPTQLPACREDVAMWVAVQAAREAGRRGTWVLVPTNDTYAHVSDLLEGSKPGYLPRFLVFDLQGADPDGYRELYMHAPQQMAALALLRWGVVPVV